MMHKRHSTMQKVAKLFLSSGPTIPKKYVKYSVELGAVEDRRNVLDNFWKESVSAKATSDKEAETFLRDMRLGQIATLALIESGNFNMLLQAITSS